MAKQKSNLLRVSALENYILVTEQNRKFLITLGRILYIISRNTDGQYLTVHNKWPIRPQMRKGNLLANDDEIWVRNDESREEYADAFSGIIKKGIAAKDLYIKKNEKLIIYRYK